MRTAHLLTRQGKASFHNVNIHGTRVHEPPSMEAPFAAPPFFRITSPPFHVDRQTTVKTLPSCNFVCGR